MASFWLDQTSTSNEKVIQDKKLKILPHVKSSLLLKNAAQIPSDRIQLDFFTLRELALSQICWKNYVYCSIKLGLNLLRL